MLQNEVGTCNWLVEELTAARIVERERLEPHLSEFLAECPYADADAFAKHLAREGIISKYQARRAIDGDCKKLAMGAYLLVDVIGSGSLGPVYKAVGRADQKAYAVKVLPRRAWNVRLARSQVRAFDGLPPHEGIVPFIDVGTAHGLHYLVWPFVAGRTLESLIQEHGPLSTGEIARIGVRIAESLKAGLTRGLVHGLIKPSNVLIAPDGQAKLLDFGIGALLADNMIDEMLVDTVSRAESLAHMLECASPECVADAANWHPLGDQYSLGCTLYFAATGRYPFPGGSFVDKIVNHQMKKAAPVRSLNPDVPAALAELIERLMHKAPGDRFHRLEELIGELAPLATVSRIHQPEPINIHTPSPMKKLRLGPPEAPSSLEPPVLELTESGIHRGLLDRLFGGADKAEEPLGVMVVAAGPVTPGDTIVLHVYVHGPRDERPLAAAARRHPDRPRLLTAGQSRRSVAYGSRVGLHLGVSGATVAEPLQEFDRAHYSTLHRFTIAVPRDARRQPLTGRLMVGQEGRLVTQVDFILPFMDS
jgi:serine/threonine protein kinase